MKLDRLLAITMLLLNRGRVNGKELSERFEVSLRTIYRDLETINQAGIPIVSYAGTSGGYEIMEQYLLHRQFLTLEELQSIVIALRGVRSALDERDISGLLEKVGALIVKKANGQTIEANRELMIDFNPWQGGKSEKNKINLLKEAILNKKIVEFQYFNAQGGEANRKVEPMGLVLKGYIWYLNGFCLLRNDYRIFRLTRMNRLLRSEAGFELRASPTQEILKWQDKTQMPPVLNVCLHFSVQARVKVMDRYEPEEIETLPDGSLRVRTSVMDTPSLYERLLGFGAELKVIEPPYVADQLKAMAQKIVERYNE